MGASIVYATPWGPILIREDKGRICLVAFSPTPEEDDKRPSTLTNACANQLLEYLAGKRRVFDVPLALDGTGFEQAVWQAVQAVPYGQVCTCTDIARAIGQPTAHRQVGRAAADCPLTPLVPAHRIKTLDDVLSVRLRQIEETA